jgi:hypothetical protein
LRQSCEQLAPGVLLASGLVDEQALGGERGAAQVRQGGESQPALLHAEAGTPGENPAGAEPAASRETCTAHAAEQNSEDLLGINPEATGPVVLAVVVSLLLAALILTVGSPLLAAGVALAMLALTALDIREVTHQLHESRPGLAALAPTVALLHLLAGAAALLATRGTRSQSGRHQHARRNR